MAAVLLAQHAMVHVGAAAAVAFAHSVHVYCKARLHTTACFRTIGIGLHNSSYLPSPTAALRSSRHIRV